jgi:hypothetical protein
MRADPQLYMPMTLQLCARITAQIIFNEFLSRLKIHFLLFH